MTASIEFDLPALLGDAVTASGVLEAEDELQIKRMSGTEKRVEACPVATTLNPSDPRPAGTHTRGHLLLCQPMIHAIPDKKPGNLLQWSLSLPLGQPDPIRVYD